MWSFVGHKGNKQGVWLALDVESREIIEVHVGQRDESGLGLPEFFGLELMTVELKDKSLNYS